MKTHSFRKTDQGYRDNILDTGDLPLVKIIRYNDEFAEKYRLIQTGDDVWNIITDGKKLSIDWSNGDAGLIAFLKKFIVWCYKNLDATTVFIYLIALNAHREIISLWVQKLASSETAKQNWEAKGYNQFSKEVVAFLRSVSKFMCEMSLCGWTVDDAEYVKGWKWYSSKNASNVDHGYSYHLTLSEERAIISYLNLLSLSPRLVTLDVLRNAIILYFCYQFGMRPMSVVI